MGTLVRKKKSAFLLGDARHGPLPDFADSASLRLLTISASVSALVVCYQVRPQWKNKYLSLIDQYYEPVLKTLRCGYTVLKPQDLIKKAVENARKRIQKQITLWFRNHFKGVLCSSSTSNVPICEMLFITPKSGKPYSAFNSAFQINGWSTAYAAFDHPGMTFHWPLRGHFESSHYALLICDRENLSVLPEMYGDDDDGHLTSLHSEFDWFLSNWGISSLMKEIDGRLTRLRDAELGLSKNSATRAIKRLRQMTLESADVSSIAHDFASLGAEWMSMNATNFGQKRNSEEKDFSFTTAIIERNIERAEELRKIDASLKALALQNGNLLVADANLKLQKSVWALTIVAILIAVISAIEPARKFWTDTAKQKVELLSKLHSQ